MPALIRIAPGQATLVATGCGTAIACVCALGLVEIDRRLGGLWSVLAVLAAGLLCAALARVLGRLSAVVPSGAGLLAFLSRGLGRRWALVLVLPYAALVLALVAVEARIVGVVTARFLPVPPLGVALAFLAATWAVARAGLRPGLRAQAIATAVLMVGFVVLAIAGLVAAATRPDFAARLLPALPGLGAFVGGVGQALFLFMGFELVTSQVELVRSPAVISGALGRSVGVLAAFWIVATLGVTALASSGASSGAASGAPADDGAWLVPQLALGPASASPAAAVGIGLLCLLASFTSFNGALLTLSRMVYALASQGVLPRRLARMDARRLVPPDALAALAAVTVGLTFAVGTRALALTVLAAAAAAAGLVWAAAVVVRERAPFAEPGRSPRRRAAAFALAALFVAFGLGAVMEVARVH